MTMTHLVSIRFSNSQRIAVNFLFSIAGDWELSRAEKRWDLTRRRPSVQRKHAQHASHLPSRTLGETIEPDQYQKLFKW